MLMYPYSNIMEHWITDITGRCLAGNQYEITIINLHNSQDLNGTFRISAEITYLLS
jgi:hypothetical protein